MLSDVEIAAQAKTSPIGEVAAKLGVLKEDLIPYGEDIAKVRIDALARPRPRAEPGKLILMSATTPTRAGGRQNHDLHRPRPGIQQAGGIRLHRAAGTITWALPWHQGRRDRRRLFADRAR